MTVFDEATLQSAYRHSSRHRYEVAGSQLCGCFHCRSTFRPSDIVQWVEEGSCAVCPECGVDSVIGSASGLPVDDPAFLDAMHRRWFGASSPEAEEAAPAGRGDRDGAPVVNVGDLELRDSARGSRYAARAGRIGAVIGMQQLGAQYFEVPPGKAAFPRHAHHNNEEMFVILEGAGEYRRGDERWPVRAGDVIAAPAGGAESAHQLRNTGTDDIRYLAISTRHPIDINEYPDSGKLTAVSGIRPGQGMLSATTAFTWRRGDTPLDYWDGEDIGDNK